MIAKVAILLALFAAVQASVEVSLANKLALLGGNECVDCLGLGAHALELTPASQLNTPANYQYNYAVADPVTGDSKSQAEERLGDVVKGFYKVAEPDGTIRIVHYTADPIQGFNAMVDKIGQAVHPQNYGRPVYAPAAPYISPMVAKQIVPLPWQSGYGYAAPVISQPAIFGGKIVTSPPVIDAAHALLSAGVSPVAKFY